MRTTIVRGVLLLISVWLVSCGGNSELRGLEDYELATRQAECLDRQPTAPGRAQACSNVERECERRRKDLGRYVCRSK